MVDGDTDGEVIERVALKGGGEVVGRPDASLQPRANPKLNIPHNPKPNPDYLTLILIRTLNHKRSSSYRDPFPSNLILTFTLAS